MSDDPTVVELRPKKPRGTSDPAVRAKGLAAAKLSNHKPASGIPASGMPASGLPAVGQGVTMTVHGHKGPDAPRRTREGMRLAAMAAMEACLDDPEVPLVSKAFVAEKLLNRLEGMPTQMTVTAKIGDVANMEDDELAAEIDDLERQLGRR